MKKTVQIFVTGIVSGMVLSTIGIYHIKTLSILRNHFDGLATILSVAVVIILYYIEQRSKKISAARLVLKEIDGILRVVTSFLIERKYDQKKQRLLRIIGRIIATSLLET